MDMGNSQIDSLDARSDAGKNLPGNRPRFGRELGDGDFFLTLLTNEHDFFAGAQSRQLRHIDHNLIHGHPSEHRAATPAD